MPANPKKRQATRSGAIKQVHDRAIQALKLKPSIGRGTSVTTSRLVDGLACDITRGDWKLRADLSPAEGGDGSGPSPSVYGEGALAACLTMGLAIAAARRGIEIVELSVEVAADWDIQGMYGLGDNIPPGYTKLRIAVDLDSGASPAEAEKLLADVVRNSPWMDVYRRANDVTVSLRPRS
jgi:uncharacterized OsmC-like protein